MARPPRDRVGVGRNANRVLRSITIAVAVLTFALTTAVPAFADAGNITPCLHGAALPGMFGALYGSSLDSSQQAHDDQPLGAAISGFAQRHADPGAGDCE